MTIAQGRVPARHSSERRREERAPPWVPRPQNMTVKKLAFAVITAREALDRAAIPGECQN